MTPTKYYNVFVEGEDVYRITNGEYHRFHKFVDNVGYYQTVFRIDGKRKYVRIHRLIAETLVPNPYNLPMVNHIDGNKLNNDPSNLEWCTNSYNTQEAYNHNLYRSQYRCPVKVTDENGKVTVFQSVRQCAEVLGLNRKTITSILKGLKVNNYPYIFEYMDECID